MRSGMKRKFHVPFWRAVALVRESLTLIAGQAAECLDNPPSVSGDPVLPGFFLNMNKIW